jgi:hypothetical protein
MKRTLATIGLTAALMMVMSTAAIAAGNPTCGDLGWANHGVHVTSDYVFDGGDNAAGGAAMPGGPAAGGHFHAGGETGPIAPGASFCLTQSESIGWHVGD